MPSRLRLFVFLAGVLSLALLPGCIGLAVTAVSEGADLADPPQPALRDSASYFAATVKVTAYLVPVSSHRGGLGKAGLVRSLMHQGDSTDGPIPGVASGSPKARMALWTEFKNTGPGTVEFSVESVKSLLGNAVPAAIRIALAPGQKALLDPEWSDHEPNLEKLEVAIALKLGEAAETHPLELVVPPKPKAKSG